MRSVIHTITLIISSLTTTALTAMAATTVNDAAITISSGGAGSSLTICNGFSVSGKVSGQADSDVYYGGVAYSADIGGPYKVVSTGRSIYKDQTGVITYGDNVRALISEFGNLTVPTDAYVYEFGVLTVNLPLGVDSTLQGDTMTNFGKPTKIDGGKVFLTIPSFPPSAKDVKTNKMYKAASDCPWGIASTQV